MYNTVDFSFVYEMSDNDSIYVHEVAMLFLKTASEGLVKLEELMQTDEYDDIRKQAHFLKSSANIVKVTGMYDHLLNIEHMARERKDKALITPIFLELKEVFKNAVPDIEREIERTRPAKV